MTLNDFTTGKEVAKINGLQADAVLNYLHTNGMLSEEISTTIKNLKGMAMPDDQQKRIIAKYYPKITPEVLNNILQTNAGDQTNTDDPLGYGIK
jgi:hypothetical protein